MKLNTKQQKNICKQMCKSTVVLTVMTILVACGSGTQSDEKRHQQGEDTAYDYVVIYDKDNQQIKLLDGAQGELRYQFALTGAEPSLYASPDYRYAVVAQRSDNQVRFLDSGIYSEDHGDHLHPYKTTPRFTAQTLMQTAPTHYTVHSPYAVIFNDGSNEAAANISVISDESIKNNTVAASLDRENNMHGVAKLVGDTLLITRRDSSISETTLPSEIERYHFDGKNFVFKHLYEAQCPLLHGAGIGAQYAVFGCGDGVLAIKLQSDNNEAMHIDNPTNIAAGARIGTVLAHEQVAQFVGFSSTQRQLFTIDLAADDTYQQLLLPELAKPLVYDFSVDGDIFYVLGSDGVLYLFDTQTWQIGASIRVSDELPSTALKPVIVASQVKEQLYILLPEAKKISMIDLHEMRVEKTITLDFLATKMAWVGLTQPVRQHTH